MLLGRLFSKVVWRPQISNSGGLSDPTIAIQSHFFSTCDSWVGCTVFNRIPQSTGVFHHTSSLISSDISKWWEWTLKSASSVLIDRRDQVGHHLAVTFQWWHLQNCCGCYSRCSPQRRDLDRAHTEGRQQITVVPQKTDNLFNLSAP